jgi:hypothetical protein
MPDDLAQACESIRWIVQDVAAYLHASRADYQAAALIDAGSAGAQAASL